MKVLPFKIPKPSNAALLFQVDSGSLYGFLHQHKEVQISLIIKGEGTLLVGDAVHTYRAGDVIIIGGQQPHVFRNTDTSAMMHSVFFSVEAFGDLFLQLDEGKGIGDFYAFAKAGFKTTTTPALNILFQSIASAQGMHKLKHFIDLVAVLQVAKGEHLSQFVQDKMLSEKEGKKMSAIFEYSLENYRRQITLNDVAEVATMTPNAFCKYFKKRTNKTYFRFLMELRVEKSCELLLTSKELPVAVVAEQSGFQTLSHFNRTFKELKGTVPTQFRGQ
ncbi:AraC family transcriptional regulator [Dokdonia sinensis]|uniref:AraC family transcriptional regulator n=1 Tax=Dokdonia sinensis TaxID=2479847 RepID=A0A3M0G2I6_9FLAO|nr:AraC family transcriptional regulator [Dokdonia sinensis]RMB59181.1 AraC family transcriptional regulator [Dokdonia sinensis]